VKVFLANRVESEVEELFWSFERKIGRNLNEFLILRSSMDSGQCMTQSLDGAVNG
jgi:hypothetical protein